MKSKVRSSDQNLTRNKLANPFMNVSMMDRLKNNNSVDLRNNHTITHFENGYDRIEPIDSGKKFTSVNTIANPYIKAWSHLSKESVQQLNTLIDMGCD